MVGKELRDFDRKRVAQNIADKGVIGKILADKELGGILNTRDWARGSVPG
jgi:hypothetical protein